MEPTIFCDVEDDMFLAKEESFGPIMCISKVIIIINITIFIFLITITTFLMIVRNVVMVMSATPSSTPATWRGWWRGRTTPSTVSPQEFSPRMWTRPSMSVNTSTPELASSMCKLTLCWKSLSCSPIHTISALQVQQDGRCHAIWWLQRIRLWKRSGQGGAQRILENQNHHLRIFSIVGNANQGWINWNSEIKSILEEKKSLTFLNPSADHVSSADLCLVISLVVFTSVSTMSVCAGHSRTRVGVLGGERKI